MTECGLLWRGAAAAVALCCLPLWVPDYPHERLSLSAVRSTRVVDRAGRLLYERPSELGGYGHPVSLDELAPELVLTTLSGEDADFFFHHGVDPVGVVRAVVLNLRAGRMAYGGSTLTQQLAGRIAPRPRTLLGKARESLDALWLEHTLGKREILEQYLSRAYYGRQAYGVAAAAERFFGKAASDLTLDEAALLSVLPRAPSAYAPDVHPDRALARRRHVLLRMAERGWIDPDTAREAADRPLSLVPPPRQDPRARHVLDYLTVQELWPDDAPDTLRLTIDLALQEQLEQRVRMHLLDVADLSVDQAGVVVLDNETRGVLAMVGSRRYGEQEVAGSVNVTTALRHPGSALKPFVYALALEAGAHPSTPVLDVPTRYRDYQPRAASREHHGLSTLREALGSSLNVPAVRTAEAQGLPALIAVLRRAGLETIDPTPAHHGLALALGAAPVRLLDLTGAYAALANQGRHRAPTLLLADLALRKERKVVSSETAYLLTRMLADPVARRSEFGMETPLELPFEVAAKTGTSQSYTDNVVVGFTPEVTVGVWVGNFDGRPMHGVVSMQGAAPLFRDAFLAAVGDRPQRPFSAPDAIVRVEVCPLSGALRGPHCPHGHSEEVARRNAPHEPCAAHRADGIRLPPELVAHPSLRAAVGPAGDAAGPPRLHILSPAPEVVVVVDHVLPLAHQAVPLRAAASPTVRQVRWEVDGEPIATVGPPFAASWTPTPGEHQIRAVALTGDDSFAVATPLLVE